MARKKISINDLYVKREQGVKVSWLTYCDFPTAQFQEEAGVEMILVGQFQAFTPKFVKKYCDVAQVYTDAFQAYIADVKEGGFPEDQHCYHIIKGQEEAFAQMIKKYA